MCEETAGVIQVGDTDSYLMSVSPPDGSNLYAVTQTLRLRKLSSPDQFDSTADTFVRALVETFGKTTLVTELHESGDVHYHGIIRWPDSLLATQYRYKQMSVNYPDWGFYKIKLIDKYDGWAQYLQKDVSETCRLLNRSPILRDDFCVFKDFDKVYFRPLVRSSVRQVTSRDCFIKENQRGRAKGASGQAQARSRGRKRL